MMQSFTLAPVPEIVFGSGRIAELASRATLLAGRNVPVALIADPALDGLGITARALAILAAAGHATCPYDGLRGEPKASDIDRAAALAREHKARAVVGLGGGSALDTAKLVASCAVSGKPVEAYQLCQAPLPADHLPIIAVPTTAGTGAEVTRTCIFSNSRHEKVWAWGDELKPEAAILDPDLTLAVPRSVTAATGLDALVHAIEASTNRNRHDASDLYCHRGVALIADNLERAVKAPGDVEARGAMLLGSCYAGIGIDNCGTALAHNISHAIANLAAIPHGRATGLAMLATIDWVAEGNPHAFTKVAAAMGGNDAAAVYGRLVRASGIKISLHGDGLDLKRPDLLAEQMALPVNSSMRNATVRTPTDADLIMLAERVYALVDA
jgi:alcohol dehydrogenase class IV